MDLASECGYGLSDFFDGCSDVGEGGAVLAAGFGVGCEFACCGVSEIAFDLGECGVSEPVSCDLLRGDPA